MAGTRRLAGLAVAMAMVLAATPATIMLTGCSTLEILGTSEDGDALEFHGLRGKAEGWLEVPEGTAGVAVNLAEGHIRLTIEDPGGEPVSNEDVWASMPIDLGTDAGGRFHVVVDASGDEEGATGSVSVNAVG